MLSLQSQATLIIEKKTNIKRNLPDELAREIIQRGGIIGLNFVRRFVGNENTDFCAHIHHGLSLGGEEAIAIGADFYGGIEIPIDVLPELTFPTFQTAFANSSCYPAFCSLLEEAFSKELVEKIAYKNAYNFLLSIKSMNA